MVPILYEDNHVIAVQKSHGMLVQSDNSGDPTLINEVRYFIKQREGKPGDAFLGMIHRLDRPVGGVVIFGKTSKGSARLCDQFRTHGIEKVYWCVVENKPSMESGIVKQWLVKDEVNNVVTAYDHEVTGSQYAETSWKVISLSKSDRWLVEVKPKTGRSHQIRVAMKTIGCPIVGDMKYGGSHAIVLPNGSTALALFARSLAFDHVITKERIVVVAEPELDVFKN